MKYVLLPYIFRFKDEAVSSSSLALSLPSGTHCKKNLSLNN